jgi:nicotinate-nucleotide--dimethylbenzimidazole phosphoribosyltransferase
MFAAIARGQAASSVLARSAGIDLEVVDVGIDGDVDDVAPVAGARVAHAKVARGSASFTAGPAMSEAELDAAMAEGAAAVARACARHAAPAAAAAVAAAAAAKAVGAANGLRVGLDDAAAAAACRGLALGVGELGIGNTTAAAALLAALTGAPPSAVVGRGTGVGAAGLAAKAAAVAAGLEANAGVIAAGGPRGALRAVGGLELAAMAGAYVEAARRRLPVVVDGFISGVAALAAARAEPGVAACLFASHTSAEAGARRVLGELGLRAPLDMGLRLGEVGPCVRPGGRAHGRGWRQGPCVARETAVAGRRVFEGP